MVAANITRWARITVRKLWSALCSVRVHAHAWAQYLTPCGALWSAAVDRWMANLSQPRRSSQWVSYQKATTRGRPTPIYASVQQAHAYVPWYVRVEVSGWAVPPVSGLFGEEALLSKSRHGRRNRPPPSQSLTQEGRVLRSKCNHDMDDEPPPPPPSLRLGKFERTTSEACSSVSLQS